jgi:GNAT superfamily N-acetyltransferase
MSTDGIIFRKMRSDDMPGVFHVRTSVRENLLTTEQLARMDITPASVAESLSTDAKGWVAERGPQIVAFSIADRASQSIFALFVLPEYERHGLGRRLLDSAVSWLWDGCVDRIWLTTAPNTRAAMFYEHCGWVVTGFEPNGEVRFELTRA